MSRIFDALQRSESERSGVECSAAPELLRTAEKGDFMESESLPGGPCHACGRFVPCNSLFCPNCDLFQGSVATEDSHNGESDSEPDPALSKRTGSWIYAFLRWKWIQIALAAGLTLPSSFFSLFLRRGLLDQRQRPACRNGEPRARSAPRAP
jgi:hypothetical protein